MFEFKERGEGFWELRESIVFIYGPYTDIVLTVFFFLRYFLIIVTVL